MGKDKSKAPESKPEKGGSRAKHYLDIERASGDAPGKKEMAMTKKPRDDEATGDRARQYVEIDKGRKT